MWESAASRNHAADPPQLLQEEPRRRFYGSRRANGNASRAPQIYIYDK